MKCQHGLENCDYIGQEHDEDCCFNGNWEHKYICQECGLGKTVKAYMKIKQSNGLWKVPVWPPKHCPRCKTEFGMV